MALNAERVVTLNMGLGRDSITMLCLLVEGRLHLAGHGDLGPADIDYVVFSDTGCEWRHTYDVLPAVRALCAEHGIRFVVLAKGNGPEAERAAFERPTSWAEIEAKAAAGGYHVRPALMADYQSRATVASLAKGDCTDNHKIGPMKRLLSDWLRVRFCVADNAEWGRRVRAGLRERCIALVGIAADETRRLEHGGKGVGYITERHPLVDMGIAKRDEQPHLERHGFGHVRKSGCFCCPYQPLGWYWALSETDPETWARVVEYERVAMERNPRMAVTASKFGRGRPMPLPIAVERWRAANPAATVAAVLDKSYSQCLCEARQALRDEAAMVAAAG